MKQYSSRDIHDSLLSENSMYLDKGEYVFGISRYMEGVSIAFHKQGDIKFLFQSYDLDKSKTKDKRPEFIRISYYENNLIEINLVVDFDENHDKNKKIHLNYDYISNNNLKNNEELKFLEKLNHFEVITRINEKEKSIIVDLEKTFIMFLEFLRTTNFYKNFDKVFITKIHPSSDSFLDEIEQKLKEIYPL